MSRKSRVTNLNQLQKRSAELQSKGYVAVRPDQFIRPNAPGHTLSWGDLVRQTLSPNVQASAAGCEGGSARNQVANVLASSGGENKGKPKGVGTDGLGFMEWGLGNRLPNLVWMLSQLTPFTAAGLDFIKYILVGRGPSPKYSYSQYVAGNLIQKSVPFRNAGVLLRGWLSDLRRRQIENPTDDLNREIKALEADLATWEQTNAELSRFIDDNDLMDVFLNLAGDMALMNQCFVELQLNQRQLNDEGEPVPTSQWTPKVTGLKHRSVFTTRLERMDKNYRINYAYCSNRWLDSSQVSGALNAEDLSIAAIPFLPATSAVKDLERKIREARMERVSRKNRPTRFIMSPRNYGGPYYANAMWHSIFAGSIFEYAFTIVDDRLTRKRNSNIIGRVIYIHQDYLSGLFRQQGEKQTKTIAQIQSEVFESINSWLSNSDNAGQALISSVFTGPDGKEHKAWEVVEIESKAKDQSEADKTELQEISSIIFFAMGLDSKLIGNTPGDVGSSGGTDLRERFLVKQIQFAPMQQLMLRPLEVLSRFNGWDEHLVWEIDREVLTTLDNSKTGITKQES